LHERERECLPLPPHAVSVNSAAAESRADLSCDVLELLAVERTAPSRHEAPPQRDRKDEVQDGCDDDEETRRDVRCVREDRVEVADEEGEREESAEKGEEEAERGDGDECEPLRGDGRVSFGC
jgi:hypothetical protein